MQLDVCFFTVQREYLTQANTHHQQHEELL